MISYVYKAGALKNKEIWLVDMTELSLYWGKTSLRNLSQTFASSSPLHKPPPRERAHSTRVRTHTPYTQVWSFLSPGEEEFLPHPTALVI